MININVEGGTAKLGENLCKSCRHAVWIELVTGADFIRCQWIDKRMSAAVVRCNSYQNKNTPDVHSMKEIAWTVSADPKGTMGFRPPDPNKKRDILDDIL